MFKILMRPCKKHLNIRSKIFVKQTKVTAKTYPDFMRMNSTEAFQPTDKLSSFMATKLTMVPK